MRKIWIPAVLLMSSSAFAGVEQDLQNCSTVQDKLDRLICYDNLAAGVSPAAPTVSPVQSFGKKDVAVTPVSAPAKAQTSDSFGITKPTGKQLEQVELTVSKVKKGTYGNMMITFANGQVWKQTDNKRFKLKSDQAVFIKKGAFGSFLLGTQSRNTTIRVKRVK